jgi:hypothetical protein
MIQFSYEFIEAYRFRIGKEVETNSGLRPKISFYISLCDNSADISGLDPDQVHNPLS